MRIFMRKSFISLADTVSARGLISSLMPRFPCGRFQEPLQLRTSSSRSGACLHVSPVCSPRHTQTRDFLHVRVTSITNGPPLKHMSSRPILPLEPQSIPLSDEEKMSLVKAEYELYKAEGEVEIPSQMKEKDYEMLVQLPDAIYRKKHLKFLFKKEMKTIYNRQKRAMKLQNKHENYLKVSEEVKTEEGRLVYGLWRNSMFINYPSHLKRRFYTHRIFQAKMFGQPIIIDCGYDSVLNVLEKKSLAEQVADCIGVNRFSTEPYYIHMCNFRKDEDLGRETVKKVPGLLNEDYPVDTHPEDYLDLFPREKLVYITPHCRDDLLDYDHNAIYIIGGILKLSSTVPFLHAKLKKQGIKMQKLPYDRYLNWRKGSKTLPLNLVLGMLLEVKRTGNWMQAFEKYVPESKLTGNEALDRNIRKMANRSKVSSRRHYWDLLAE